MSGRAVGTDVLDPLDAARRRVRVELRRTGDEREAFREFASQIRSLAPTVTGAGETGSSLAPALRDRAGGRDTAPSIDRIRRAYEHTVMSVPHYDEVYGDGFEASVREEFGPAVAAGVESGTVTADLRDALASGAGAAAESRDAFAALLAAERDSLRTVQEDLTPLTERLENLRRTGFDGRSFVDLYDRYRTLDRLEDDADALAATRQETLVVHRRSTGLDRSLPAFLYEDLDADHPALAALGSFRGAVVRTRRRIESQLANS